MNCVNPNLYELFREPSNEYRGKPFWAWNGELDKDELIRQIHVMKKMGFGGFFMHSRTGLETEYLGEKWFELINACADEAEKLGMEAWLYDEDRWPSGTAGGMVTENPDYRLKFIRLHILPGKSFTWKNDYFAAFSCQLEKFSFYDCKRITRDVRAEDYENQTILAFSIEEMGSSSFYNGYTYVDTMKRAATERFLELTHEMYKKYCGDRLGRSIKGIFVDEPHRGALLDGFSLPNPSAYFLLPWTDVLFTEFKEAFGYDLVDKLPALFLQEEGNPVSQVKWHYVELLQRLLIENFAKPVQEWCQKHHLILTGHILHEDTLTAQTAMSGSMMRYYPYMDYPGVDVLTEGNNNYWIVKQLTSVARQLGKKWLLSELYGCTGWQMTFENHKAVGNWQALFGINLRCHHLSWYTMKGEAKRDYPASILHQSTWWEDYKYVETYFSRLGVILSQGEPHCEVLVLNPVESVWCQIYPGWSRSLQTQSKEVQKLEQKYKQLFHWLSGAQIDFDYGDEGLIPDLYSIEKTKDRAILHIGKATYKTVIIHGMLTIRKSTLQILEEFINAGGTVIFIGEPPTYVDALPNKEKIDKILEKATYVNENREEFLSTYKQYHKPLVTVEDANTGEPITDIFCQIRKDEGTYFFVLMNVNREKEYDQVKISFSKSGTLEEWNCQTGERHVVAKFNTTRQEIISSFPVVGEKVYVLHNKATDTKYKKKLITQKVTSLQDSYSYKLQEPNVFVLDFAKFKINGGKWQEETEILKVDQQVRKHFGIPYRGGEMVQPWFRKKQGTKQKILGRVSLQFRFDIKVLPKKQIDLVMEDPEIFSIRLNGKPIRVTSDLDWWIDRCFKRIPLSINLLQQGTNTLEVEVDFHELIGFEALYLIGEFGVYFTEERPIISDLPKALNTTDVTNQGLPFYSGTISYEVPLQGDWKADERIFLEVPSFSAACVKVTSSLSNRKEIIAWPPYEADITQLIRSGAKKLQVDVVLTRRNTFGPLHLYPKYAISYGPGSFITRDNHFTNEYQLIPSGLLAPLKIVTRKENKEELNWLKKIYERVHIYIQQRFYGKQVE